MPILKPTNAASFNEVPERLPLIDPGIYTVQITKSEIKATSKGTGVNLVLTMKITTQGRWHGRVLSEVIFQGNEFGDIQTNNLAKIAGVTPIADGPDAGALNTDDFVNKLLCVQIGSRQYTDPKTNQMMEVSEVKRYVKPTDPDFKS